jgi:hypothetical protein
VRLGSITPTMPVALCRCGQQIAHSRQVVGGQRQGEHPAHPPSMASLAQGAHSLEPAEGLFDPLAPGLTDNIAAMAAGPLVDRTVLLLCNMRSNVVIAQLANELLAVIALIRPQSYDAPSQRSLPPSQPRSARPAMGLSQPGVDRKSIAVLDLDVPQIAELGLSSLALLVQPCFAIGGRLVGGVGTALAVEVYRRIAGVIGRTPPVPPPWT